MICRRRAPVHDRIGPVRARTTCVILMQHDWTSNSPVGANAPWIGRSCCFGGTMRSPPQAHLPVAATLVNRPFQVSMGAVKCIHRHVRRQRPAQWARATGGAVSHRLAELGISGEPQRKPDCETTVYPEIEGNGAPGHASLRGILGDARTSDVALCSELASVLNGVGIVRAWFAVGNSRKAETWCGWLLRAGSAVSAAA